MCAETRICTRSSRANNLIPQGLSESPVSDGRYGLSDFSVRLTFFEPPRTKLDDGVDLGRPYLARTRDRDEIAASRYFHTGAISGEKRRANVSNVPAVVVTLVIISCNGDNYN